MLHSYPWGRQQLHGPFWDANGTKTTADDDVATKPVYDWLWYTLRCHNTGTSTLSHISFIFSKCISHHIHQHPSTLYYCFQICRNFRIEFVCTIEASHIDLLILGPLWLSGETYFEILLAPLRRGSDSNHMRGCFSVANGRLLVHSQEQPVPPTGCHIQFKKWWKMQIHFHLIL